MPVAEHQGFPDRGGDQALAAADVEHLTQGPEHGGDDLGVARQPAHRGGGELVAGVQDRGAEPGAELLEA